VSSIDDLLLTVLAKSEKIAPLSEYPDDWAFVFLDEDLVLESLKHHADLYSRCYKDAYDAGPLLAKEKIARGEGRLKTDIR
jgi:hypothetical protein